MITILFDIDGTLLYSHGAGKRPFAKAFAEQFGAWEPSAFPDAHGKTDPAIADEVAKILLGRSLTEPELDRLNARYVELFESEIKTCDGFEVLPGVTSLIPRLAAMAEFQLGLQTGNLRIPAYLKLARAGVDSYFSFGGFACDSRIRPELVRIAIERAESRAAEIGEKIEAVVVVGDTVADLEAASACGAGFLGVRTGRRSSALDGLTPPETMLPDLADERKFLAAVAVAAAADRRNR